MNDGRQMELHYIDTGFPYTVTESFMDFFQGLSFVPVNYAHPGSSFDQESVYWSMNLNPYKFGYSYSGPGSTSYYGTYEVNDHFHFQRMEFNRGEWGCPMTPTVYEPAISDSSSGRDAADSSSGRDAADSSSERDAADSSSGRDAIATNSSSGRNGVTSMQTIPEECSPDHQESSSNQVGSFVRMSKFESLGIGSMSNQHFKNSCSNSSIISVNFNYCSIQVSEVLSGKQSCNSI